MAHSLLVLASRTLNAPSTSPALMAVAAEALLTAIGEGLDLPTAAARALWGWLRSVPAARGWHAGERLGRVADREVTREAIALLQSDDGEDLHALAADVLSGEGHAGLVTEDVVQDLAERARTGPRARAVSKVIQAVHEARTIEPWLLRRIRNAWASSPEHEVREASLDIEALLVEPEVAFVERLLSDEHAAVRAAAASRLGADLPGGPEVLALVEARLQVETHRDAGDELLRAKLFLSETGTVPGPRCRRPRRAT